MTPRRCERWRALCWAALGALLWAPAPAAAGDLFEVRAVTVDATAENAQLAQEQALALGQRRALEQMLRKLTLEVDHDRLPQPGPELLTRLVRGYEVVNERRSGQRYIAELAVRFDPEGVRETLRQAAIPFAETVSPRLLVLPVVVDGAGARLWVEPNPWLAAWRDLAWSDRLLDLVVPFGELGDVQAVTAEQALAAAPAPLAAIAARYEAAATLVAVAQSGPDDTGLTVAVGRYGAGAGAVVFRDRFAPAPEGRLDDLYRLAALAVATALEGVWKRENLIDYRVRASLPVSVALSGLEDWLRLRRSLEPVSQIEHIEVESLGTREARLVLHHFGPRERLAEALAARRIALAEDPSGGWRLELGPAGGAAPMIPAVAPEPMAEPAPQPVPEPAPALAAPEPGAPPPGDTLLVE